MGMIMHDDVPYGEGTSYTQGTGIAINNNVIAVDADNTPTENSEKPVKSKGVYEEIEQIYADNGVLGAKNLLPNNATSQTINGVTFTVNADKSVTVNGTATATAQFKISSWADGEWEYNPLKTLSGCPKGGSTSTYYLRWIREGSYSRNDIGDGVLLDVQNNAAVEVKIIIASGYTANNLVFKPMLRLASDPDDTYVPYAMTNRELTDAVTRKKLLGTDDLNNILTYGDYYWENATPSNTPENQTFCAMCVYPCGEVIHQEIIRGAGSGASIYVRRYQNSWSSWYKFTGTSVS